MTIEEIKQIEQLNCWRKAHQLAELDIPIADEADIFKDCPKDRKDVDGKPLPLLFPFEAIEAYSKVSDCGLEKYGDRESWKHCDTGVATYSNAAARHLFQSASIGGRDLESGLPHLYHALWSVAAAIWHYERGNK